MNATAVMREVAGSRDQADRALEAWLRASLRHAHGGAAFEPIPDDLLLLCYGSPTWPAPTKTA